MPHPFGWVFCAVLAVPGRTAGDRAFHKADGLPGTEHFIKRPQRISVDFKRHTRLQTLDAIKLFNAVSRQALNLGSATDTKDERDNRRRHECDGEKRSNDRDATALGCCGDCRGQSISHCRGQSIS
jgi:hypothetical protein